MKNMHFNPLPILFIPIVIVPYFSIYAHFYLEIQEDQLANRILVSSTGNLQGRRNQVRPCDSTSVCVFIQCSNTLSDANTIESKMLFPLIIDQPTATLPIWRCPVLHHTCSVSSFSFSRDCGASRHFLKAR